MAPRQRESALFRLIYFCSVLLTFLARVHSADPSQFFVWNVAYKTLSPLGVPQRVITINDQFPGPQIDTITNNVLVINVFNKLDEPLLFTWNGIQQRKSSWQDGVLGTNCPILPGKNWTYQFQAKDQIGSFFYYPSNLLQRAAGGYGGITVYNRGVIKVPYNTPAAQFTILAGDWYTKDHTVLRSSLDAGSDLGLPNGVLINGRPSGSIFTVEQGKTYRIKISNVGVHFSLNFRIQGHKLFLVETEGSYTLQTYYDSLDIHMGQSYSVLVTADQSPGDFNIVASTRFYWPVFNGLGVLHYSNSRSSVSAALPAGPDPGDVNFSFNQARSIRWNLTTGAARPNPQGSYHYGKINVSRTIILSNSAPSINGRLRYAVNDISYINPTTPLKLADYFQISGVFTLNSIPDSPQGRAPALGTSVLSIDYHAFVEIIFQNSENTVQSWHLDGYNFFVVGMGPGKWNTIQRKTYNLYDAVARSTVQVYANSWTAIYVSFDNVGIWNLRSQNIARQYLGQELYIRIYDPTKSFRNENPIPANVLLCGKAGSS